MPTYGRHILEPSQGELVHALVRRVFGVLLVIAAFEGQTSGAEVAYLFDGRIRQSAPTFGLPQTTGALSGRIVYDASKTADYPLSGDAMGYRQQRPNGFYATFGDIHVRADDYVMEVFNDLPQGAEGIADVVTFAFTSDFTPPLSAPIMVNGAPRAPAQFLVSFLWFDGQKFQRPLLEEVGAIAGYDIAVALLGDSGRDQSADVFADQITATQITTLTADFNGDLSVDGADFLIWQRAVSTPNLQADANQDGAVTALDLAQWTKQWDLRTMSPPAFPVPEVGSGVAALQAVVFVVSVASRRAR
jgi:hypothetical protein